MTDHPFDPDELGSRDERLASVGARLERYAAETGTAPSRDLSARVRAAVDAEADRPRPFAALLGSARAPARALVAIGLLALAVTGAIVVGQLANLARERVGSSPSPSVVLSPSETPTPSPRPSPTPTPTPSDTPSPSPSPAQLPAPSSPTPEATPSAGADGTETPDPTGSDSSGPGGGGDNSGPGGGGSDGSGSDSD